MESENAKTRGEPWLYNHGYAISDNLGGGEAEVELGLVLYVGLEMMISCEAKAFGFFSRVLCMEETYAGGIPLHHHRTNRRSVSVCSSTPETGDPRFKVFSYGIQCTRTFEIAELRSKNQIGRSSGGRIPGTCISLLYSARILQTRTGQLKSHFSSCKGIMAYGVNRNLRNCHKYGLRILTKDAQCMQCIW